MTAPVGAIFIALLGPVFLTHDLDDPEEPPENVHLEVQDHLEVRLFLPFSGKISLSTKFQYIHVFIM